MHRAKRISSLLRRATDAPLPFQGLWANLTPWNVLEFKGPTVSPRVRDLDLLVELGRGIDRRLNEERARQQRPLLDRQDVSLRYLAIRLGRRFLRDAQQLLGLLEPGAGGIWRCSVLGRMIFLISSAELPIDGESVPLHLVGRVSPETTVALARFLAERPALWRRYGGFLATYSSPGVGEGASQPMWDRRTSRGRRITHRRAWEKVLARAKTKEGIPEPDREPLLRAAERDKTGKLWKQILEIVDRKSLLAMFTKAEMEEELRRRSQ